MSETKPIHVGRCIDDLDKEWEKHDFISKKVNSILLCRSAIKVLKRADQFRIMGDEENAYVYYMKFLKVMSQIQGAPDYVKEKKNITNIVKQEHCKTALTWAEKLKESLCQRYIQMEEKEKINQSKEQNMIKQKIENDRQKAKETLSRLIQNGFPDENEISIKATDLFDLLKDKTKKVLILDARSQAEYEQSHMKYPQCISIPKECIKQGIATHKMEKDLPKNSLPLWSQRKDMDLIVLLDWSSTMFVSGTNLHTLQTMLLKWDITVVYKRTPILLDGGYEGWLLRYPQMTTNSRVSPPNHNTELDDLLNEVNYPTFVEPFSPTDKGTIDRKTKSVISNNAPSLDFKSNIPNPTVDRSSKAAALETYEKKTKAMKLLLEEQEKLASSSFSIEKERILTEEKWEKIHQSHENEFEMEKKETLQLKESELLSHLMQLESKQTDMNLEIKQLKEQLECFRSKREANDTMVESIDSNSSSSTSVISPNANSQPFIDSPTNVNGESPIPMESEEDTKREAEEALTKERKIREIEKEKEKLEKIRETMQEEREKILADARAKKRQLYNKQLEESERETLPLKHDETSSGFNRSHSSPNIAQMLDDELVKVKTPQFDRTMKPIHKVTVPSDFNQARQRDFQGVWGCVGRGLTGLKNLGNTCYMNSIMQCLSNTADLAVYFCRDSYRDDVRGAQICSKGTGGTRGAVAEEVAAVVKALWSGQFRFISAKDLRNVVGKHQTMFRGIEQQDSHEFLTILMDWLHNDLQTPSRQQIHLDTLPPSEKAWHEYTKFKESLILRLFYGQIKSTLTCLACRKESITHDSFSNLSLELPAHANKCTLSDCLDLYLQDERILDWNCPSCKQKREAVKKLDISRLPPILVIHFKRFYVDPKDYISNTYRKKLTNIDFPLQNLDMGQFSLQSCKDGKNTMYNLYGVSNHYGSMEGGHYTAYCKSSIFSKWYKFDDHVVGEISPSDVKSSAAYILFYSSLSDGTLHH